MTPADIISEARGILQDTDDSAYRYSDDDLLQYVNDAINTLVSVRPEFFVKTGSFACNAGSAYQALSNTSATTIVDVIGVTGGGALTKFDIDAMNAVSSNWKASAPGPAKQWARHENSPLAFYIYPPAPPGQSLEIRYVAVPPVYSMNDVITDVPDVMRPAIVDYVVAMAESRDDEHVLSERAARFMNQFASRVKE